MADRFQNKDKDKQTDPKLTLWQNTDETSQRIQNAYANADKQVSLPESLRGDNLLSLLDGVEQEPAKEEKPKKQKNYFLSWQAFVTYAAVFAILFAAVRLLPTQDSLVSETEPRSAVTQSEAEESQPDSGLVIKDDDKPAGGTSRSADEITPHVQQGGQEDTPEEGGPTGGPGEVPPIGQAESAADSAMKAEPDKAGDKADSKARRQTFGVGGSYQTYSVGQWNGLDVTWRANDPTDPDKKEYPITIELVSIETGELEQQIDIKEMTDINMFYTDGAVLVFGGNSPSGFLIKTYTGTDDGAITLWQEYSHPGRLRHSEIYQHRLYLATSADNLADGWETVVLKNSSEKGSLFLSIFDLEQGGLKTIALQGSTGETVYLETGDTVFPEQVSMIVQYKNTQGDLEQVAVRYAEEATLFIEE